MGTSPRPNVILVLADQHHADLLGCAGHTQALTPNLDAFAAEGVRFTQAYCQNPICTPSRVSWLSGQYCHNHGFYGLSGPAWFELPNLFRHFRAHGYRTAGLGKLHLPCQPRNWVADDLDLFADAYQPAAGDYGRSAYLEHLEEAGVRHLEDSWHNPWLPKHFCDARPSELPYEHTMERWITDRALDFVAEGEGAPFFIEIAYQRPHHPLLPQRRFWDLYPPNLDLPETFDLEPGGRPPHFRRMWESTRGKTGPFGEPEEDVHDWARRAWRGTLACVSQMDDLFGRLVQGLKDRGEYENTVIVYSGDHGCYHTIHGLPEKAPGICSDAVCRIPMIWRAPGKTRPGHVSDRLVETVDAAPTLCALCGLPEMESVDGRDLTPLLAGGEEPVHEVAVTENPWSKSLRWGRWRFVHYQPEMWPGEDVGELYDLAADPQETTNLYDDPAHRETVESCRRKLLEWLIGTTRCRTVHPPRQGIRLREDGTIRPQVYETAGDGKESNRAGPAQRAADGQLNYL
jgi:choline-sulfatase/uncharacterized sulfatase